MRSGARGHRRELLPRMRALKLAGQREEQGVFGERADKLRADGKPVMRDFAGAFSVAAIKRHRHRRQPGGVGDGGEPGEVKEVALELVKVERMIRIMADFYGRLAEGAGQ